MLHQSLHILVHIILPPALKYDTALSPEVYNTQSIWIVKFTHVHLRLHPILVLQSLGSSSPHSYPHQPGIHRHT